MWMLTVGICCTQQWNSGIKNHWPARGYVKTDRPTTITETCSNGARAPMAYGIEFGGIRSNWIRLI